MVGFKITLPSQKLLPVSTMDALWQVDSLCPLNSTADLFHIDGYRFPGDG